MTHVDLQEGRDAVVKLALGRKEIALSARVVVDASGRQTMLGNHFKLKVKDTVFDQYAIHTWFDNFDRAALTAKAELAEYIHIHFLPVTNTWVWQIPITDGTTSLGVVTQKAHFSKSRESPGAILLGLPGVAARTARCRAAGQSSASFQGRGRL